MSLELNDYTIYTIYISFLYYKQHYRRTTMLIIVTLARIATKLVNNFINKQKIVRKITNLL